MKTYFLKSVLFFMSLFVFSSITLAGQCHYVTMEPGLGKIKINDIAFDFGEPDNLNKPQAWQGPISITHADQSTCTVDSDVSILERPIYQDGEHLLVTTYSGDNRRVFMIDIATCRILWKSKSFMGEVYLTDDELQLGKQAAKLSRSGSL